MWVPLQEQKCRTSGNSGTIPNVAKINLDMVLVCGGSSVTMDTDTWPRTCLAIWAEGCAQDKPTTDQLSK